MESIFEGGSQGYLEAASVKPGRIEETERTDVAKLPAGFHHEKTVVETGELLHRPLLDYENS